MAGTFRALQSPTSQSSCISAHRQADFWPQTSSFSRLWLTDLRSRVLPPQAPSASVRFCRISNSFSNSVSNCENNRFRPHRNFGFSLAASADDWASVGTKSSEADHANKGWTNSPSDLPEAGSQAQAALNKDTFEATVESDDALKAKASNKDDSGEPANKFMGVLRDTTEELKEQAEKARAALAVTAQETASVLAATAQETAEKSKENLSYIAENAPEPIREIADTALKAHSDVTPKKFAKIHDFCLGIPYGTILVIGGLLLFIISGSTVPIRFGVMLGGILLALSVTSLSAWKEGKPTTTYIIGQGVIAAILALRQIRRLGEVKTFISGPLFTLLSVGMLGFYCYVLMAGGNPPSKKTNHAPAV